MALPKRNRGKFVGSLAADAKRAGKAVYHGKPCLLGHGDLRRVSNGNCTQCENLRSGIGHSRKRVSNPEIYLLHGAKQRSRVLKCPFNLTAADILAVWPVDNRCPVFPELELQVGRGIGGPKLNSPTLDKIRPALGYVVGNIAVISWRANHLKGGETDPAAFRAVADWLERAQ